MKKATKVNMEYYWKKKIIFILMYRRVSYLINLKNDLLKEP